MFTLLNTLAAFAGPSRTTYQAKIIKPDGYPLEASVVNFKFTILDPSGSCAIYAETFNGVNMGSSGGLVSFSLGSGIRTFPVSGSTFEQVFSNTTASLACDGVPATYSPLTTDTRKILMQFHDGGGWQTLPAMTINAVPYAMYANDSLKFSGKDITEFVQVASLPTCTASQAMSFNGAGFSCIAAGGTGSVSSAAVIAALGYTPADGASLTAITSNVNSVSSTVFSVSSTVTSLQNSVAASFSAITSSQWLTSGTAISYSLGNVGIGTSDPQRRFVVRNDSNGTLTNTAFYNGDTTNNNAVVLSFRTDTTGSGAVAFHQTGGISVITTDHNHSTRNSNLGFYTESASSPSALRMNITGIGNVGIGITNPVTKLDVAGGIRLGAEAATCSAGYAGTLRYSAGIVEYCNGTSWVTFGVSGAGILAINGLTSGSQTFAMGTSGVAPNVSSTGTVHTFNFPFASDAATTAGLISYADYTNFSNKQAALGYTAANVVSVTTLASTVASLSSSVAASFSTITSSQWVNSGSTIHYNDGYVGLNTTNPIDARFVISHTASAPISGMRGESKLAFGGGLPAYGQGPRMINLYPTDTIDGHGIGLSSGMTELYSNTSFGFFIRPNRANINATYTASEVVRVNSTGMGIGTTTPAVKLHVAGPTGSSNFTASQASGTMILLDTTAPSAVGVGGSILFGATYYLSGATMATGSVGTFKEYAPSNGSDEYNHSLVFKTNRWQEGVSERMRITSLGYVGIGTSAPTARLQLSSGTTTYAPLKFTSGAMLASPQAGAMEFDGFNYYLTDGSNVRRSIATGSSAGAIDNASTINSTGNITMVPVGSVVVSSTTPSTSTSTGALVVKGGLGVAGNTYIGGIINAASDINVSGSIIGNGNIGQINFVGNLGDSTGGARLSSVGSVDIAIDTDNNDTVRQFRVMTNSSDRSSATTLLAVTEAGNVGIGTTVPTAPLHIASTGYIRASGSQPQLVLKDNETTNSNFGLRGDANYGYLGRWNDDGTVSAFHMAIDLSTGNVGIGTSSPSRVLEVVQADTTTELGAFINSNSVSNTTAGALVRIHNTSTADNKTILRLGKRNSADTLFNYGDLRLNNAGDIEFAVGSSSPSLSIPEMVLSSGGNLGIGLGASAPATRLHLSDNAAVMLTLDRPNTQNSLIEYKNTLGSIYAGQIIGSTDFGVGTGIDLGATGVFRVANSGRVYIGGTTLPTARLHITPGTSQVAPIRLAVGTLVTTPQSGTIEYDGNYYYITDNANVRRTIATATTAGTLNDINTVSSTSGIVLWPASGSSVTVSSTVASTNSSTGALIVNGGAGISGALNVGGIISGSAIIKGTGFRANQGAPDAADSSTVGYAFGQDGDTGIFSPGAGGSANGILSFYSNNAERMRMTASGSLGIGVIPAAPLHISNTSTQVKLILGKDDNSIAESSLLKIDAAGTSSYTAGMVLTSGGNQTAGAAIFRPSGTGGLYFKGQTSFTTMTGATTPDLYVGTNGHVGVGIANPTYQFTVAKDFSGLTSQTAAFIGGIDAATANSGIYVMTKDNTGLGSNNSYLLNAVHNNISKFIVTGAGNVGIGTSAPTTRFQVASSNLSNGEHALVRYYDVNDSSKGLQYSYVSDGVSVTAGRLRTYGLIPFYLGTSGENSLLALVGSNVGIGTTSPLQKLDVKGVIQTRGSAGAEGSFLGALSFYNENSTGFEVARIQATQGNSDLNSGRLSFQTGNSGVFSEKMTVLPSGNVGIGTTNPSSILSVEQNVNADTFVNVINNGSGTLTRAGLVMTNVGTAYSSNSGGILLGGVSSTTAPNQLALFSNSGIAGGVNISASTGGIRFATGATERMRVDGTTGNVGIGTTTPAAQLHIGKQEASPGVSGSITRMAIQPYGHTGGPWKMNARDLGADAFLDFYYGNGPVMTFENDGDVGIGTLAPTQKLHVTGGMQVDGDIYGGLYGGTRGIWRFSTADPNFGIFYTESSPDRISFSPNGGGVSTPAMVIHGTNIGIGVSVPAYQLHLSTDSAGKPGTSTWTVTSDSRLKDIRAPFTRSIAALNGLNTVYFNYKQDNPLGLPSDKEYVGIKAQDVLKFIPEAVSKDDKGYLHVTNDSIIWTAVNAIKELYHKLIGVEVEIKNLRVENANKDRKIQSLEQENAAIKAYLCSKDPAAPICK